MYYFRIQGIAGPFAISAGIYNARFHKAFHMMRECRLNDIDGLKQFSRIQFLFRQKLDNLQPVGVPHSLEDLIECCPLILNAPLFHSPAPLYF
jgi:hypothetical protein